MRRLQPETAAAVTAARAAGRLLLARVGRAGRVWHKTPHDLVTSADVTAGRCIARLLAARFPAIGFLGEESGRRGAAADACWIVDPLDGTTSFLAGLPTFAVCVALARDGRVECGVTYLPRLGELFVAERGRGAFLNGRRLRVSATARLRDALLILWHDHSVWSDPDRRNALAALACRARTVGSEGAGFSLACVAAGRADAYWEQSAAPWDVAAGALLVEEAGGRATDGTGRRLSLQQPTILATNGRLHRAILGQLGVSGCRGGAGSSSRDQSVVGGPGGAARRAPGRRGAAECATPDQPVVGGLGGAARRAPPRVVTSNGHDRGTGGAA